VHTRALVLDRKGTKDAATAAIARGKSATIDVEWLTAPCIEWAPTRPVERVGDA
jgi:hypothetical protein